MQTRPLQIAPSILACDFARLGDELAAIEAGGADVVHVDVMDGHFVPNLSIGLPIVKAVRGATTLPVDTHLMIANPERYIERYAEAGSDWISVHAETCPHLDSVVSQIIAAGAKPGVVLNPHTSLAPLEYLLERLHHVLIMSVNPGFGGQSFLPSVLPKIAALRERIVAQGLDVSIEVDGGIGPDTIQQVRSAGADVFVAGSAVFKAENYKTRIALLRERAETVLA
ncbi:MAG: ribulose-phosphate 3-epimerase [Myxococcota bacterium]|jgi:ribulose-phosphate 3-epimerase